jgi:hypothetical protein
MLTRRTAKVNIRTSGHEPEQAYAPSKNFSKNFVLDVQSPAIQDKTCTESTPTATILSRFHLFLSCVPAARGKVY